MSVRDSSQLLKLLKNKKLTEEIELGIYNFSQEYVKNNNIEFLLQSIYDSKMNEIIVQRAKQIKDSLTPLARSSQGNTPCP